MSLVVPVLAGCILDSGSTFTATFATNWSGDSSDYYLTSSSPLPKDFHVIVLDKDTGLKQEIAANQINIRLPGKYDIRSSVPLKDVHTYRIEGFSEGKSVGFREVKADNSSMAEPSETTVRASYSFVSRDTDTGLGNASEFILRGTGTLDANPTTTKLLRTGTGTMNQSSEGMSMQLTISRSEDEETDGNTTRGLLVGDGRFTFTGATSGSGRASMRGEFLGREMKGDASGKLFLCEKSQSKMEMSGSLNTQGQNVDFTNHSTETTWDRVDTGVTIWRTLTWTTTYTFQGQTIPETGTEEGPVSEQASDEKLGDLIDFEGMSPFPPIAGDNYQHRGKQGAILQNVVFDAGMWAAGGQTFPALRVAGTASNGPTGTETMYMVRDGGLATMPLSWSRHFTRGSESSDFTLELISVA